MKKTTNSERAMEFNMNSGAHQEKLPENALVEFERKIAKSDAAIRQHAEESERTRTARIAAEEQRRTSHLIARPPAPRPKNAPPEQLPTRLEIKREALEHIERGDMRRQDELAWQKKARQEGLIQRKVGIEVEREPKGRTKKEDYEARKQAFLASREAKRQDPDYKGR